MTIRRATLTDWDDWLHLRLKLWPDANSPDDEHEMRAMLDSERAVALVAEAKGRLIGWLEASIRDVAESCMTRNVGYIEGWFVDEAFRRQGVGSLLVQAAEAWAREQGCREMASDCLLENETSRLAHEALGYREVERLIHFVKSLAPTEPDE